jgi:hypothetical protein
MITPFHAIYYAHELTRKHSSKDVGRLSQSLFDASVDLNPHQIEAALFALKSPLSKGALLADEVGLGKTIEAGIVLCQYWSERKRRLLIICPASLRKQWALELEEKFNLPSVILNTRTAREFGKQGISPLQQQAVIILSYNYANKIKDELRIIDWHLVVIDEAHKLRNAYRESNKIGQGIRYATRDAKKLLLTATPLQNSLLELYGLSTLIDEHLFGDIQSFRSQYTSTGSDISELRDRLKTFCKRTLRNQVTEYIRYTERRATTIPFNPSDNEQSLYEAVSNFILRKDSFAIPKRQRHLTELVLRKLLASSTHAISGTLETMKIRIEELRDKKINSIDEFPEKIIVDEDFEYDLLDEILESEDPELLDEDNSETSSIDFNKLNQEITELDSLIKRAREITTDSKSKSLLKALEIGFQEMKKTGAKKKALIFTESRRTQEYLSEFLQSNGYSNDVVLFNGSNNSKMATEIYESWLLKNQDTGRITGSRDVDIRAALIEHFKDTASVLIATEAAAEGVNIQFCSLVINYDLPWNPQRVEQRIGRCHRYGQNHDVVVVNFLNERNQADKRVLEILTDKFKLFNGVFGASDDVLGSIESGVDFEKRILSIYQECRTSEEIDEAFSKLRSEMDEEIQRRMHDTQKLLLENFDEDVHERLKMQLQDAKAHLDRFSKRFWDLSTYILKDSADFEPKNLTFLLSNPPLPSVKKGIYHLISKLKPTLPEQAGEPQVKESDAGFGSYLYRLSHPLGEYVTDTGKKLRVSNAHLLFKYSDYEGKISQFEVLKGKKGILSLNALNIQSFEEEEYLLFSGFTSEGETLDQEILEKLFNLQAEIQSFDETILKNSYLERLKETTKRHVEATISKSLEENNKHFQLAREKLERWADDLILASEKALKDTKEKIKTEKREARLATALEAQHEIQLRIKQLERKLRKQRQEIFDVEDDIAEKRDQMIDQLEERMSQSSDIRELFVVSWEIN